MLNSIYIVTLIVSALNDVSAAWQAQLGYHPVHEGLVSNAVATRWDAPAMTGRPFMILAPASGSPVLVRLIEDADSEFPRPGTTHGWNAIELLATDPDALAERLADGPYEVVGAPRNLWPAPDAPRAMQALGPAGELLYFTRVSPRSFDMPMRPATTPVDRVFIVVVGGPSITTLRDFYGGNLGLRLGPTQAFAITTLSRALGLPPATTYPLATASLPQDFLVELDGYPPQAESRRVRPGHLPDGVAMVGFSAPDIDALPVAWRAAPARLDEFPYNGRRAAVTVGPAGEWVEVIATGLPGPSPR